MVAVYIPMVISMKDNGLMTRLVVMESFQRLTAIYMLAN